MNSILTSEIKSDCIKRINAINESSQKLWGKMTANEMLCHCADQIRMVLGEIKTADQSNFVSRTLLKYLVLLGMPAPKGKVETAQEIKQGELGTKCTSFEEDRKNLINLINKFIADESEKYPLHPFFGELSRKQYGKLIYSHLDHHLKQFGV